MRTEQEILPQRSTVLREMLVRLREISASWNHRDCIECATEVIACAQKEKDFIAEIDALRVRAQALEKTNHLADALLDLQSAENLSHQHRYPLGLAKMYSLRANFYTDRGNYAEGLAWHRKAYDIKKNADDPASLAFTLGAIGYTYARMQEPEKAVEAYTECINLRTALGDEWGVAVSNHGLGLAYYYSGQYDKALHYTQEALERKMRFPERENSIAMTQHSLASCLFYVGRFSEAMEVLEPCVRIKERHGDVNSLSMSYNLQACLYARLGNTEESVRLSLQALDFAEKHDLKAQCKDLHDQLAELFEEIGDLRQALHHTKKSSDLNAELHTEVGHVRFAEISAELQLAQAQHKLELERIRAAQLQDSVEAKNRELSAMALSLSQNNQMLQKLRRQLDEMMQQGHDESSIVATMERSISGALRNNKGWQNFEEKFRATHGDFNMLLASRYPNLSPVELRVCSLLLLHLSSKEIATILSVTPKSVEVYRTRIRQKMKLSNDTNLISWLSAMKNAGSHVGGQGSRASAALH